MIGLRVRCSAWALCAMVLGTPSAAPAWRQALTREAAHYPMWVEGNCVHYTVRQDCSADVPFDACRSAIDAATARWTDVDCSYMTFVPTEPASCCRVGFLQSGPNVNCIMWREDDWPADANYPPDAVGLTTLTYDTSDGRILDSDVEMNGLRFDFTTGDTDVRYDVWNTMAHEAGHMIGFDESDVRDSTMWPRTYAGETYKRDLSSDDVEAVCAIYPLAADPGACNGPYGGLDLVCTSGDDGCGCRAAGRGGAGPPAAGGAMLLLALLGIARRATRCGTGH